MGAVILISWVILFFLFKLFDEEDPVKVIHKIAKYNGKISEFMLEDLGAVESRKEGRNFKTTVKAAFRRQMISLDGNHFKSLFATQILAWSIRLLIILWGAYDSSSSFQFIV